MAMTQLKPFGQRRKTYFYAVAVFVLAVHVVVGAIFRVMPPEFEEPAAGVTVEMQIVDHLLPDDVMESSAVQMVEKEVEEVQEEEEPLPVFAPVWEDILGSPPTLDPLGPTESILPDDVTEEVQVAPKPDPVTPIASTTPVDKPVAKPLSKPPVKKSPAPKPTYKKPTHKKPPVKKKPTPKPAAKPPVKKPSVPAEPDPVSAPPQRAIPVAKSSGRTGLIGRARSKLKSTPGKYVAATWSKRPPPYYPFEQRKRGIEGTAHVRVSISSRGKITSSRLVKSTGNAQLDEAALISVKKGIMNPARRGDRAVSSEMIVPFEFYQ